MTHPKPRCYVRTDWCLTQKVFLLVCQTEVMIVKSAMQHQAPSAVFMRVCSQCAAELGSQHPLSSNMCTQCLGRWRDYYPPWKMGAIGDIDKRDQIRRHPCQTPALFIPDSSVKGASSHVNGHMPPPQSSSFTPAGVPTTSNTIEFFELGYPGGTPIITSPPLLPDPLSQGTSTRSGLANFAPAQLLGHRQAASASPLTPLSLVSETPSATSSNNPSNKRCMLPRSLWTSQPLQQTTQIERHSRAHPNIRTCATKGCRGLIVPSSTCLRCVKCVRADWKASRRRSSTSMRPAPLIPVSILRTEPTDRGKNKSVSWADQTNDDSSLFHSSSHDWISKIRHVRLKVPEPSLSSSTAEETSASPFSSKIKRAHLKLSNANRTSSPSSDDASKASTPETSSSSAYEYTALVNSLLGDSDLSDLTDTSCEESDSGNDESASDSCASDRSTSIDTEKVTGRPKLFIRIPARHSTSSSKSLSPEFQSPTSPYTRCSNSNCHRCLPPNRLESLCAWCILRQKRREEKKCLQGETSMKSSEEDHPPNDKINAETSRLPAIMDLISHELLSGDVVPGARICTPCQHIMPPRSEYPYYDCCSCRIKARLERIKEAKLKMKRDADLPDEDAVVDAIVEENTMTQPLPGRCWNRDCGIVIHGSPTCWQCTSCRLGNRRQRGKTRGSFSALVSGNDPGKLLKGPSEAPSCYRQTGPNFFTPYPEYRCQHELLADFHVRISGFLEVQSIHSLYKPRDSPEVSVFGFEGQFSVVALELDLLVQRDAVELGVSKLKGELERIGDLYFKNQSVYTSESGIFTRFVCVRRSYNPFGPPYPDQTPTVMHGELEVAVLPDLSHRLLPGKKTVVRFRLIG
ncbi:hypothetical protein AN958_12028 [Leucoagaricus sp. SymC.cos]|nr:hypothetical protein AN958_12028 [Leucoagaricus sp. SymC.cos]